MRLALVIDALYGYTHGGAEYRYYWLAKKLGELRIDVSLISYNFPIEVDAKVNGVRPAIWLYDRAGRRRLSSAAWFSLACTGKVLAGRYDVVDASVPYAEIPTLRLLRGIAYRRLVLTIHEYWGEKWVEYYGPELGSVIKLAERLIVKMPDAVVVPSKAVARKVKRVTDVPVYVVPNGVDLAYVRRRCARKSERDIDLIYLGRLVPYKNPRAFVEVVRRMVELGHEVRAAIVGDGPLRRELSALANGLPIEILSKISEEEKYSLLSRSKVLLNLSTGEGFSIVTLEAIACGVVPVAYSANGYNAAVDLIEDTGFGYVVDELDVDKVAGAVLRALNHKGGAPGDLEEYDWSNISMRYLQVLLSL